MSDGARYEVELVEVAATTVVAVRQWIPWTKVGGATIMPMFDAVYAYLNQAGVGGRGHNVCLYHSPDAGGMDVEVGVQVAAAPAGLSAAIAGIPGVISPPAVTATPAGRAARTVHTGDYAKLGPAHDAVFAWARARGLSTAGLHWEVYGDWSDDPAKLFTDVFKLLPPG